MTTQDRLVSELQALLERYSTPPQASDNLTVAQFCRLEGFSKATYYALKKQGRAPVTQRLPGVMLLRITPQEREAWHKRMTKLAKDEAPAYAARQAELIEKKREAGRKSAQSPKHVSKRRRRR